MAKHRKNDTENQHRAPIVPTPMPTIDHSSADRTSEREDSR